MVAKLTKRYLAEVDAQAALVADLEGRLADAKQELDELRWEMWGAGCISLSEAARRLADPLGKSVPGARMWLSRRIAAGQVTVLRNPKNRRPYVAEIEVASLLVIKAVGEP